MQRPNSEQLKAIEHDGGVLLKAGAGSGKTFVLIEHIIYLINEFNTGSSFEDDEDYRSKLRRYLGGIVLVTYTKKAAGELSLRLHQRIREQEESVAPEEKVYWKMAKDVVFSITVGTIHSFCYKLLGQGYFPDFDPNIKMISETEFENKIESLFVRWFDHWVANNDDSITSSFEYVLVSNRASIVSSLCSIFGDSGLRVMWKNPDINNHDSSDLEGYFKEYLEVAGLENLFVERVDLTSYVKESKSKWYSYLEGLYSLMDQVTLSDHESYLKYLTYFEDNKKIMPPKKAELVHVKEYLNNLKGFRKFILDNSDNFDAFFRHKDKQFLEWGRIFKQIFDFVDHNYADIPGITFADLEYYCLRGLQNQKAQERITSAYKYYIIDEFQDTSSIQYHLIKKLINNDFNRLFAVGDMKQAIYGFRGGELQVFKSCTEDVPRVLSLANNYRSKSEVISFNNRFFGRLLRSGWNYEGHDPHPTELEDQKFPNGIEKEQTGRILRIACEVETDTEEQKVSVGDINFLEARALVEQIKKIKMGNRGEVVAILYRKLAPTRFLIPILLEEGISFTAQVKIPSKEDPMIGIFTVLLESLIESRDKSIRYTSVVLEVYFKYLEIEVSENFRDFIDQFFDDIAYTGLEQAFCKFLYSMNMCTSNFEGGLTKLRSICRAAKDDLERIWQILDAGKERSYSIDFQYGNCPEQLLIMTAHASKGLQFDHVILGGIHTNALGAATIGHFGKYPGSYKWKLSTRQKRPYKSPYFLLEELINKGKDFSEFKRLFYVACTRAKSGLVWIDMSCGEKKIFKGEESWINGLRVLAADLDELQSSETTVEKNYSVTFANSLANRPPFFHNDSLGVTQRTGNSFLLGTLSELSVTRLAAISECPRKFYLQNVCKIEEIPEWISEKKGQSGLHKSDLNDDIEEELKTDALSRGTDLHYQISQLIKNNLSKQQFRRFINSSSKERDRESLTWVVHQLGNFLGTHNAISEELIKFPLFGYMLTGIPDLILVPRDLNNCLEVWDFKTGKREEAQERPYWFQLYAYGHACFELDLIDRESDLKLRLVYLDRQEFVTKELNFDEISGYLVEEWKKLGSLNQVNPEFCQNCTYDTLCNTVSPRTIS